MKVKMRRLEGGVSVCLGKILISNILVKIMKVIKVKMRRMRAREGVRVCLGKILFSNILIKIMKVIKEKMRSNILTRF